MLSDTNDKTEAARSCPGSARRYDGYDFPRALSVVVSFKRVVFMEFRGLRLYIGYSVLGLLYNIHTQHQVVN